MGEEQRKLIEMGVWGIFETRPSEPEPQNVKAIIYEQSEIKDLTQIYPYPKIFMAFLDEFAMPHSDFSSHTPP